MMNATMIEAAVVRETEDETDETHVIGKIDPLRWWFADASGPRISYQCPYGAPGDRLWVRETWQPGYSHVSVLSGGADESTCEVIYREGNVSLKRPAPDDVAEKWDRLYSDDGPADPAWRPSIFMPRWASRLTLEVVSIRIERLQQISAADAMAEGAPVEDYSDPANVSPVAAFAALWDEINGDRALWKSNPWVWVVEFKRAEPTPGQTEGGR